MNRPRVDERVAIFPGSVVAHRMDGPRTGCGEFLMRASYPVADSAPWWLLSKPPVRLCPACWSSVPAREPSRRGEVSLG